MTSSCCGEIQNNPAAKAGIYVLYNLGGVFVGLYRLAIAVYHIAKHALNAEGYRQGYSECKSQREQEFYARQRGMQNANRERRQENYQAEGDTRKALREFEEAEGVDKFKKGFRVTGAWIGEKVTKAKNTFAEGTEALVDGAHDLMDEMEDQVDKFVFDSFESIEEAKMKAWKGEALRGALELIPILGSAIYTGYDMSHKEISVLGLEELHQAAQLDDMFDLGKVTGLRTYF